MDLIPKYEYYLTAAKCDSHTAATLLLCEMVSDLANVLYTALIHDPDEKVAEAETAKPAAEPVPDQVEIVKQLAALPEINVTIAQQAIKTIQDKYLS